MREGAGQWRESRGCAGQSDAVVYFKHYQSGALLRDKQKFVGGVIPQPTAARRRASKRTFNDYTSSDSGASPMDLNSPMFEDESSGTPMSSRRPPGVKAAKGKGKPHHPPPRRLTRPRVRRCPRLRLRPMRTRIWRPPPTTGRCWTRTPPSCRRPTRLKSRASSG